MNTADLFDQLVRKRRSVRAFKKQALDDETLRSIFTTALGAPSNCNTQPWLSAVVSGDLIEALRKQIPAAVMQGEMSMDFPYAGKYDGIYRDRQIAAANSLYSAVGVAREDKPGRDVQFFKNFTFFDAPHVVFLFLPARFVTEDNTGVREAADLGMYAQTLMLSMTAHGVGSCPQTALSFIADRLRETLNISEDYKLMFGISFGYPDEEHASSAALTERAELDTLVRFYS